MGGIGEPESAGGVKIIGRVLYRADDLVLRWIAKRIPAYQVTAGARALGVIEGNKLVAAVAYERWNGVHCEVSIAAVPGSRWADRETLRQLFSYPFTSMDCEAISVLVAQSNLPSLNLATKLGFIPEAIIAFAAHDGTPLIVLKMFRDQCRWIENGQGKQRANAA